MSYSSHPPASTGPPAYVLLPLPEEVDVANASELLPLIMAGAGTLSPASGTLVLDLTRTRFMDSQGIRLVNQVRRGLPPGVRLHLVAAPGGVVGRLLELTGLRRDVPVYDNAAEAVGVAVPS
ncbi:STAS domain-containing protein [Streptomyces sp. bgisy022]|uniref:STAS domain-containing protein n=1 Tax=Streptomyces sp. bgisy022 TaxID=3413769 RepID=UPI003D7423D3